MEYRDLDYHQKVLLAAGEIVRENSDNMSMKCNYAGGDLLINFYMITTSTSRELPSVRVEHAKIYGKDSDVVRNLEKKVREMEDIVGGVNS